MRKVIAIDFDGCLCQNAWPEIGTPHGEVIRAALAEQARGTALILWTCRSGELLEAAVAWCRAQGLRFDAVNENLPERLAHYGSESRKVSADEYWDDLAVQKPETPREPLTLEQLQEMDYGEWVWVKALHVPPEANIVGGYYRKMDGYRPEDAFYFGHPEYEKVGYTTWAQYTDYGKTWLAYRRRPEGGTL